MGIAAFKKRRVWAKDKYRCHYCGIKLHEGTATVDHVIPRSRLDEGEKNNIENLVTACKPCNQAKGNRLIQDSCIIIPAYKAKHYI